jgi:hypothetical protein
MRHSLFIIFYIFNSTGVGFCGAKLIEYGWKWDSLWRLVLGIIFIIWSIYSVIIL